VDLSLGIESGSGYSSKSQLARVATQGWIRRELPCLSCSTKPLQPTVENTKALDFRCSTCGEPYELKSKSGPFTRWVADGAYSTLLETINSGRTPNLLLLEYDPIERYVNRLQAVHRTLLSPLAVVPRNPLSDNARRSGWQGCNIDLNTVAESGRVPIVWNRTILPWPSVMGAWSRFDFMIRIHPESQGWVRDVLACVKSLPRSTFSLVELYQFERKLAGLHPSNQHIRPKIRQQLQVLVAQGVLQRLSPGSYELCRSPAQRRLDNFPN
jgi:type II restriction enzyme